MKRVIVIVLATLVASYSCKKSEENESQFVSNYTPMAIGNYWIYQHVKIDSLGNEEVLQTTDSIFIAKDTFINGYRFYVLEKADNNYRSYIYEILRDSSGYLINNKNQTVFSSSNFIDTLSVINEIVNNDTLYTMIIKMNKNEQIIDVPAGNYKTLRVIATIFSDKIPSQFENTRVIYDYYANGIGKIIDSYIYLSSPDYFEKRLIRYRIK